MKLESSSWLKKRSIAKPRAEYSLPPRSPASGESSGSASSSPFVKQGGAVEGAPTCVTCHGSEGSDLIAIEDLGLICGKCHQRQGGAGQPEVPVRATHLMRELHRPTLTRVLVQQAIRRRGALASQDERAQKHLEAVNRLVGDQILEWHRFDLERVETNTQRALRELGEIYEEVTTG